MRINSCKDKEKFAKDAVKHGCKSILSEKANIYVTEQIVEGNRMFRELNSRL